MNFKRIILMSVAASMGLTMLASCGNSDDSDIENNGKDNGSKTVLKVLTHRTDRLDNGGDGSLIERTKAFEQKYNCTVEYTGFTNYADDVSKMMSTKDYGDVLMIPDSVTSKDLSNFFEPLGTYDVLKEKYRWASAKMYDNTVYGIAHGGTATGILYNTKVWADAGITELPKTPEEFIADLEKIKEKGDAIPFYTEYKDASWTLAQWSNLILSAAANPNYKNELLENKNEIFAEDGGYYKVFKLMYDVMSNKNIIEEDPMSTEWESSKQWLADGQIGTIVMGSWAISQFEEKASNKEDIGYMPAPFTAADGKQYAQTASDYCLGVNKNSNNKELAKNYITWFVEESDFAADEGMIPTPISSELPENLDAFKDCVLFEETAAPSDLQGKFDEIDSKSELGTYAGDAANFKIKMAEAAFAGQGQEGFDQIIKEWNQRWAAARDQILG